MHIVPFQEQKFLSIINALNEEFQSIKLSVNIILNESKNKNNLISDVKRLEQSSVAFNAQLDTLNKLLVDSSASITEEKIHEICHDLRNPIGNIFGYGELILNKLFSTEENNDGNIEREINKIFLKSKKIIEIILLFGNLLEENNVSKKKYISESNLSKSQTTKEGCVLVVDDDELSIELMQSWLAQQHLKILTAKNGSDALAVIEKHPEIDIILLDVVMKELGGLNVLKTIKSSKQGKTLPIIMISGLDKLETIVECIKEGAEDYIIKPFNSFLLNARIFACLEKKRLQRAEFEMKEQLHLITNALPVLISSVNSSLEFLFNNQFYAQWFCKPIDQFKNKHIEDIFPTETHNILCSAYESAFNGQMTTVELVLYQDQGEKKYLTATFIPHKKNNVVVEVFSIMNDVSQSKRIEEKLKHMATHDALTNLPNRNFFDIYLANAIAEAKRSNEMFALFFIDIDDFKLINDTVGHDYGDLLLIKFSESLTNSIRAADVVVRLGGDEFVVLAKHVKSKENIEMLAEEINSKLPRKFVINEHTFHITISIGISIFPLDGNNNQSLIKKADIALYNVKENGKDNFKVFDSTMPKKRHDKFSLKSSLHEAINKKEFCIYYQPIVEMKSKRITGIEALLRWQHPYEGLLVPSAFLHIAEETELLPVISEWVLTESCQYLSELRSLGLGYLKLNVNISPKQFQQKDFIFSILNTLDNAGLNRHDLVLEITENLAIHDIRQSIKVLQKLKDANIGIVLDDFGTGFSCLSHLTNLPLDGLKIDHTFIGNINKKFNQSIVSYVLSLTKNLGIISIAEGVENKDQVQYLEKCECDFLQGFLFYKPMTKEHLKVLLTEDHKQPMMVK